MRKLGMVFAFSLLMILIAVSNVLPVWASPSLNQIPSVSVSNTYNSHSHKNEIKKHLIVEKLVCRYINGQKRCWDE